MQAHFGRERTTAVYSYIFQSTSTRNLPRNRATSVPKPIQHVVHLQAHCRCSRVLWCIPTTSNPGRSSAAGWFGMMVLVCLALALGNQIWCADYIYGYLQGTYIISTRPVSHTACRILGQLYHQSDHFSANVSSTIIATTELHVFSLYRAALPQRSVGHCSRARAAKLFREVGVDTSNPRILDRGAVNPSKRQTNPSCLGSSSQFRELTNFSLDRIVHLSSFGPVWGWQRLSCNAVDGTVVSAGRA